MPAGRRSHQIRSQRKLCSPASSIYILSHLSVSQTENPFDILHLNEAKVSGIESSQRFFVLLLLPAVGGVAGEVDGKVEVGAVEVEVDLEVSAVPAEEKLPTWCQYCSCCP